MDGVTGFSLNAATAYTSLAVITRFNPSGMIDAIDGTQVYTAMTNVPYTMNSKYHFRVVINPAAHTYSAYVTPPGGSETQIASNYAFRTEQATTASLNDWAIYSEVGTHTLCNFALSAVVSPPTPAATPAAQTSGLSVANATVTNITTNSATVSFTTSATATSQIIYGANGSLNNASAATGPSTSFTQTLTGLTTKTVYTYEIVAYGQTGTLVYSDPFTFTTR